MAERKMGEMLKATKRAKGQLKTGVLTGDTGKESPTLAVLGLSRKESSEAQKLAALPETEKIEIAEGKTTVAQVRRGAILPILAPSLRVGHTLQPFPAPIAPRPIPRHPRQVIGILRHQKCALRIPPGKIVEASI